MLRSNEEAYILGLWCADGYHRTSSFGLSNINLALIKRFRKYLLSVMPKERLRLRVYIPLRCHGEVPTDLKEMCDKISYLKVRKAAHIAYQIYVNSRPMLRNFRELRKNSGKLSETKIIPYLAGRFDGDGSVGKDFRRDMRIVYSNSEEAENDKNLLAKIRNYKTKIYYYKNAKTYCLYVSRYDTKNFFREISLFSSILKSLCPVETVSVV